MNEKNNYIEIFDHAEFGNVRIIHEGDDKFLFCGPDVTKALGYTNSRKALADHCKGVTKRYTLTNGGKQALSFIPEGDVYRLIVSSKLPAAEKFEHWIFEELLPSIRKYGAYITPEIRAKLSKNPRYIQELVDMLQREEERSEKLRAQMAEVLEKTDYLLEENLRLNKENQVLSAVTESALPKAKFFDYFIDPGANTNFTLTAKELRVSPRALVELLVSTGFLYRTASHDLLPYQKWVDAGFFVVKDRAVRGRFGAYTLVTPKGKVFLHEILDGLMENTAS